MKYIEKPIVVDAVQFFPSEHPWPEGLVEFRNHFGRPCYQLRTSRGGELIVGPGDYVITYEWGRREVLSPDLFKMKFAPVDEED